MREEFEQVRVNWELLRQQAQAMLNRNLLWAARGGRDEPQGWRRVFRGTEGARD